MLELQAYASTPGFYIDIGNLNSNVLPTKPTPQKRIFKMFQIVLSLLGSDMPEFRLLWLIEQHDSFSNLASILVTPFCKLWLLAEGISFTVALQSSKVKAGGQYLQRKSCHLLTGCRLLSS